MPGETTGGLFISSARIALLRDLLDGFIMLLHTVPASTDGSLLIGVSYTVKKTLSTHRSTHRNERPTGQVRAVSVPSPRRASYGADPVLRSEC